MEFNLVKARRLGLKVPKRRYSEYDGEELRRGVEEELEHSGDREVAAVIAGVHLDEDPRYYSKLSSVFGERLGRVLGRLFSD